MLAYGSVESDTKKPGGVALKSGAKKEWSNLYFLGVAVAKLIVHDNVATIRSEPAHLLTREVLDTNVQ